MTNNGLNISNKTTNLLKSPNYYLDNIENPILNHYYYYNNSNNNNNTARSRTKKINSINNNATNMNNLINITNNMGI